MVEKEGLPEDLVSEILVRLPVKSLLRFKSVSKPWRSRITSSQFTNKYFDRSSKNRLIFLGSECGLRPINYNDNNEQNFISSWCNDARELVGSSSCKGLVLLATNDGHFLVWNPLTHQYKEIPQAPSNFTYKLMILRVAALVYDSVLQDFKVITSCSLIEPHETRVMQIFNLKGSSWTLKEVHGCPYNLLGESVLVNGVAHWIASLIDDNSERVIVSYDVEENSFKEIAKPVNDSSGMCLVEHKDSLCIAQYLLDTIEIWKMQEYGVKESWKKLFVFEVSYPENELWRPLFFLSDTQLVTRIKEGEYWEDAMTIQINDFLEERITASTYLEGQYTYMLFNYSESLVSPH